MEQAPSTLKQDQRSTAPPLVSVIAQPKSSPALPCPTLPSPNPNPGLLGFALTCFSSLSLYSLSLSLLLKSAIYSGSSIFVETENLCYPTTCVVSHQITINMVAWSEVNQFAQPKPSSALP